MPAPENTFKKRLLAGELQIGCWLATGDDYVAEVMGTAGHRQGRYVRGVTVTLTIIYEIRTMARRIPSEDAGELGGGVPRP